jgi:aminocarboxymuconate-semialdehyde decarboxylase
MIIDIFTHVFPRPVFDPMMKMAEKLADLSKRMNNMPMLHNMDARFREMDEFGDYRQIVCMPNPPLEDISTPAQGAELARIANDSMAELVQHHPDRFPAFIAALPMHNMDAAMEELPRAIEQLDARGVQVFSNVGGRPLDDPEFAPVFAKMHEYGLPVWLHPARTADTRDYAAEQRSGFEAWTALGWPYATSVAMLRLVYTGLFDRHPGIKVITHHLGGIIPYHEGRLEAAFPNLGRRSAGEDYMAVKHALRRPFIDYFKMFYGDTAMHGAVNPVRCGLEFFGPRNVVFASDAPFSQIRRNIDVIYRLDIGEQDRHMIFCGNAERIMKMKFT